MKGDAIDVSTVELVASEHAFTVPELVPGGPVRLTLDNRSGRVHMLQVARIDEGRTVEDVVELIRAFESGDDSGPPAWFEMRGVEMSPVGPGPQFSVLTDLVPGHYVAFCLLSTVDGSHATHGMVRTFDVVAASAGMMPDPDLTLVVDDDGFTLPSIAAGRHVIAMRNDGSQPHQFEFGQLRSGFTFDDAVGFLQRGQVGELPAEWAGGVLGVPPGETVLGEVDLQAGTWTVVDLVGDEPIARGNVALARTAAGELQKFKLRAPYWNGLSRQVS